MDLSTMSMGTTTVGTLKFALHWEWQWKLREVVMPNNDHAVDQFLKHISDATEMLEVIKNYVDNHMDTSPEEVHYGHVGSAGKVCMDLRQIMEFLNLKK